MRSVPALTIWRSLHAALYKFIVAGIIVQMLAARSAPRRAASTPQAAAYAHHGIAVGYAVDAANAAVTAHQSYMGPADNAAGCIAADSSAS